MPMPVPIQITVLPSQPLKRRDVPACAVLEALEPRERFFIDDCLAAGRAAHIQVRSAEDAAALRVWGGSIGSVIEHDLITSPKDQRSVTCVVARIDGRYVGEVAVARVSGRRAGVDFTEIDLLQTSGTDVPDAVKQALVHAIETELQRDGVFLLPSEQMPDDLVEFWKVYRPEAMMTHLQARSYLWKAEIKGFGNHYLTPVEIRRGEVVAEGLGGVKMRFDREALIEQGLIEPSARLENYPLFHGTSAGFTRFDVAAVGRGGDCNSALGVHFSPKMEEAAEHYAAARRTDQGEPLVIEARVTNMRINHSAISDYYRFFGIDEHGHQVRDHREFARVRACLIAQGVDAVSYTDDDNDIVTVLRVDKIVEKRRRSLSQARAEIAERDIDPIEAAFPVEERSI